MNVPNWIAKTVKRMFAKRRHPITNSRGFKLQLELLEDRVVPTGLTLYVGTAAQFSSTTPGATTTWTPGANYAGFTTQSSLTFDTGTFAPGSSNAFTNLQDALDQSAADNGAFGAADTIKVAPGIYTNDYNITAPVSLLGSNIYVNTASSPLSTPPSSYNSADPEATVIQAPAAPSPAGAALNDVFRVLASHVTIKGFFINGNSNADDGITNLNNNGNTVQVSNLLIWNNIIQGFSKATGSGSTGIYFDDADPGTSSPDISKASTGNAITHNFFAHDGAAPAGTTNGAINFNDNFFATVYANTINVNAGYANATSVGIEIGNYNTAGIGGTTSMSITGNSIALGQDTDGIFVFSFGQATNKAGVYLAGNTIQAPAGVSPSSLQSTYGTSLKGIQSGAFVSEQDTIGTSGGQLDRGIDIWNSSSSSVLIYSSTIGTSTGSPAPVIGIDLHDLDAHTGASTGPVGVTISGGNINGTKYGLNVEATNFAATAVIGSTAASSINGVGGGSGNGIGINLNGIGALASAYNATVTTASTITGQTAALQTSGTTSSTGLNKTFLITGSTITVTGATDVVSAIASNNGLTPGSFTIAAPGTTVNLYSHPASLNGLYTFAGGVFSWGGSFIPSGTYSLVFSQVVNGTTLYQHVNFVVS